MTQALLHARRKLFGPSTEAPVMEGQTTLFDDMQSLASELLKSKKELTVKSYTRTARKPGVRQEMLAGLPTEIEEYIINPEEKCAVCGSQNSTATFNSHTLTRGPNNVPESSHGNPAEPSGERFLPYGSDIAAGKYGELDHTLL